MPVLWVATGLAVLGMCVADAWLTTGEPLGARFRFLGAWCLPPFVVRAAWFAVRGTRPRPLDRADRVANATDTGLILLMPSAFAVAEHRGSFAVGSVAFLCISMLYGWILRSDPRHPFAGVMAAGAGLLPHLLCPSPLRSLFLAVVVPLSVLSSLLLGFISARTLQRQRAEQAAERAAQAERVKALSTSLTLALSAYHDAGNALTAVVLGVARLSRESGGLSPELAQRLEKLKGQVESLKEILVSARNAVVTSGDALLQSLEPAPLGPALEEARALLAETHPQFHVSLATPAGKGEAAMMFGGATYLSRVLHNLLLNAAQGDGTRGARAATVRISSSGGELVLSVEDDGPGFTAEQLAAPIRPRSTTKQEGSGLGLYTAELLVLASGGTLRRENASGGGAVVTLGLRAQDEVQT
ncbi:MAG: hypothetical protein RL653_3131 [Pseudomonadota bacterium]